MTAAEARYLEAIHRMHARRGRVTVNALGRSLGVRPASVSQMLGRLAAEGLVERDAAGGVGLTVSGENEIGALTSRRALVERFLREVLEVPEADVSAESGRLVQIVSARLEARMRAAVEEGPVEPEPVAPVEPGARAERAPPG